MKALIHKALTAKVHIEVPHFIMVQRVLRGRPIEHRGLSVAKWSVLL